MVYYYFFILDFWRKIGKVIHGLVDNKSITLER